MTITSVKVFAFGVAFGAMLFNEPPTPNFAAVNAALIRFQQRQPRLYRQDVHTAQRRGRAGRCGSRRQSR